MAALEWHLVRDSVKRSFDIHRQGLGREWRPDRTGRLRRRRQDRLRHLAALHRYLVGDPLEQSFHLLQTDVGGKRRHPGTRRLRRGRHDGPWYRERVYRG